MTRSGVGMVRPEKLKDLVVQGEFVFIEVQEGKNPILVKEVVGNRDLIEEIDLGDLLLLLKSG